MPINSFPVDQSGFTQVLLVSIQPKLNFKTREQDVNKNGEPKWTVQVAASVPSRMEPGRVDSELLNVTVVGAEPGNGVMPGEPVEFTGLTAGVVAPDYDQERDKVRGGTLFWSAQGVRSKAFAGKS